jgi:hypothetical protein
MLVFSVCRIELESNANRNCDRRFYMHGSRTGFQLTTILTCCRPEAVVRTLRLRINYIHCERWNL